MLTKRLNLTESENISFQKSFLLQDTPTHCTSSTYNIIAEKRIFQSSPKYKRTTRNKKEEMLKGKFLQLTRYHCPELAVKCYKTKRSVRGGKPFSYAICSPLYNR